MPDRRLLPSQLSRPGVLVVSRNFDSDLKRLSQSHEIEESPFGLPDAVTPPPNLSQQFDQTPTDTVGNQPLPAGARGTATVIRPFREKNQRGQTYGISVQADELRTQTNFCDAQLYSDLVTALRELGFTVLITDAFRGSRERVGAKGSRHKRGKALDIGLVNGRTASLQNPDCVTLTRWFIAHGYVPGGERGNDRALLLGPVGTRWNRTNIDHTTHLHISIR